MFARVTKMTASAEWVEASETMGEDARAQTAQSVNGRVLSVERYEVVAQA